jgi:cytochrome b involved in lipid metabolism
VLLDDLVLDIGKYIKSHPGGKKLLEYNVGRDVSKFFYGGYAGFHSYTYTHSKAA